MSAVTAASSTGLSGGRSTAGSFVLRPAHLNALLRQVSRAHGRVVAVQTTGSWAGGADVQVDGHAWRVVQAASQLAVREALVAHEEAGPDDRLIVLTPLDTLALGLDVRARLVKQRVFTLHAWELLNDLFRARAVDPRVARLGWLGDVLLEQAPPSGYPPAPGGVLDLDTAWSHAFAALLGIHGASPDALTLLRWSTRDGTASRWAALPPDVRDGLVARLRETAGPIGDAVAAALNAGNGERLVALGLVCDVLWPGPDQMPLVDDAVRDALASARVRLEPMLAGHALPGPVAREWAGHAQRVLLELSGEQAAIQRRHAEQLLDDVRAADAVVLSGTLAVAAPRRAALLAKALVDSLDGRGSIGVAEAAATAFALHATVVADAGRAERAIMAVRIARALREPARGADGGLGAMVRRYVNDGSWLDAARTALLGGDASPDLAQAYAVVLRRARERREVENLLFAERLVAWNASPAAEPEMVPVERAIELMVAPVADARPVLVVLLDGLDMGVWRALRADLAARHWTWWQPAGATTAPVAVATLPSVTSASRASLFAGVVKTGNQSTEKPDFAAHGALARSTVNNRRPVLFHKAELGSDNALSADLRRALDDRQQRVVGVVVNAVDDWLDKSDQVLPRWSINAVPLLDALMQEAAVAGRAVVVLSDHGHLLDHDTVMQRGGEGARWRAGDAASLAPGEVLAMGPRVRAACGHDAIVVAASEALRYTGKKTGYHGGAAPQEVIAPIAVLARDALGMEGWRPVLDTPPSWWDASAAAASSGAMLNLPVPPAPAVAAAPVTAAVPAGQPAWVDALLTCPVYASQRTLVGRTAPADDQMRAVLGALAAGNGRVARSTLAAALAMPEVRVRGLAAGVRRVLNVEGFPILEEEEGTGTLSLNLALLRKQFSLPEGA